MLWAGRGGRDVLAVSVEESVSEFACFLPGVCVDRHVDGGHPPRAGNEARGERGPGARVTKSGGNTFHHVSLSLGVKGCIA